MDEIVTLAATRPADFTTDFRAKFAQSFANYCQEVLNALPTNTPAEDDWVAAEQRTGDAGKILRVLKSKEYSRSILKQTFSDCRDTTTLLIQIQNMPEKRTEVLANLEARKFIALALNFNSFLDPYSSRLALNKELKFALGDIQLQMIRWGLLKAATKALQDVH